jgi:hypothetical protein
MRSLVRTQAETSYGELFGCIGHRTFGTLRPHCANLGTQCSFPDSRSQLAVPEGSPPVNDFGRLVGIEPNSGERLMTRKMLRPVALIGTVAAMLTVTIVLTLSHSTVSMSGVGSLKCYGAGGIQKAC